MMTNAIIDTKEQGGFKYAIVFNGERKLWYVSEEYRMTRKEMNLFLSTAIKFGYVTKLKTYTIEQK